MRLFFGSLLLLMLVDQCTREKPILGYHQNNYEIKLSSKDYVINRIKIYNERGDVLLAELKVDDVMKVVSLTSEDWRFSNLNLDADGEITSLLAKPIQFNVYVHEKGDSTDKFFYTFNNQLKNGAKVKKVRPEVLLP